MELDAISQPQLAQIEQVANADLVIGIFDLESHGNADLAVAMTRQALAELSKPLRAMVISNNGTHAQPQAPAQASGESPLTIFYCNLPLSGLAETPQQSIAKAYRSVFAVGGKLGVRACSVIASWSLDASRSWIHRLVQPVLDLGFDLVTPCYTRPKTEGLLNRSVLAPLFRALYGEQLQNPYGPDFGLSGKLLQQVLKQEAGLRSSSERNLLASVASAAACGRFQICESYLGVRAQRPVNPGNLSSLLAEVLGAVFLDMEARAPQWQSIRGSRALPRFGPSAAPSPDTGSVDVRDMIESFRLGTQNLEHVWGMVLPPATLFELSRVARLPEDQFRLPDRLWARIVYDFALGYRLRIISRDHLLRSITPLYLGWIASYALETQSAGPAEVDSRLDLLSKAYEDNKSYLVSRWRWPDRFNP